MNWVDILFLGDSLTFGSRDPHGLAWPYYLAHEALHSKYVILPQIEAVPGRTSSELLRASLSILSSSPAAEVFVLIGTNDAKDEVNTPSDVYISNMRLLWGWCLVFKKRLYVCTIPEPMGFGSPGYTATAVPRIKEYNRLLRLQPWPVVVELSDICETTDGVHFTLESARKVAIRAWMAITDIRTIQ